MADYIVKSNGTATGDAGRYTTPQREGAPFDGKTWTPEICAEANNSVRRQRQPPTHHVCRIRQASQNALPGM